MLRCQYVISHFKMLRYNLCKWQLLFPKILIHVLYDFPVAVSFFAVLRSYSFTNRQENVVFQYYTQAVVNICCWVLADSHNFNPCNCLTSPVATTILSGLSLSGSNTYTSATGNKNMRFHIAGEDGTYLDLSSIRMFANL